MENSMTGISIIVPFLDEAEGIEMFCEQLDLYCKDSKRPIELVFVDDGSTDGTGDILSRYSFEHVSKIQLVTLSKNFGSHAAIRAGVAHATMDICTWMGSDLQEPIEFIEMSCAKIEEGYDAVYVEKNSINISALDRGFSKMYSALMRRFAVKNYSSGGVSNIVFNQKVIQLLRENPEGNSSIMLQIMDAGFRNTTISLDYKERAAGKSKWTLSKKIKLFIDSFVSFSFMPIRLVSIVGMGLFFLGLLFGIIIIVNKFCNPELPIAGYPTLACLISVGFGITNISLGIIAEYLWRAYDAARKRPVYIISDVKKLGKDKE